MSHVNESLTIIEQGNAITIASAADYSAAAEFLKGATALQRSIQTHYAPLKAAAHTAHKNIVDAEKEQLVPINRVIERVKGEIIAWDQAERRRAAAEQAKLQAVADKKAKRTGMTAPVLQVEPDVPKVDGMSGRGTWKAVVFNMTLVPREYLIPDQKALDEAARRMKEHFNIPGVRAIEDRNVVVKGV